MIDLAQGLQNEITSLGWMVIIINLILHIIFANAVARDAAILKRQQKQTQIVSGLTWACATLVGGVLVAALYWLLHYSTLAVQQQRDRY